MDLSLSGTLSVEHFPRKTGITACVSHFSNVLFVFSLIERERRACVIYQIITMLCCSTCCVFVGCCFGNQTHAPSMYSHFSVVTETGMSCLIDSQRSVSVNFDGFEYRRVHHFINVVLCLWFQMTNVESFTIHLHSAFIVFPTHPSSSSLHLWFYQSFLMQMCRGSL